MENSASDPAAAAFIDLRGEVALLRRAIKRLADERATQPDYTPTLEAISQRLENVCVWARKVSERPAIKLTPESMAREISAAATASRAQDREMIECGAKQMGAAIDRFDAMVARSREIHQQNKELIHNRIAFAAAGIALCAILPGAIARSLPVSWAVPERIAARMLRRDMWHAGQDMMVKAGPARPGINPPKHN